MKHFKSLTVLLAAVCLVALLAGTALAAGNPYNVWIDAVKTSGNGPRLAVPVQWDATATDGLLTITYDPAVLSVKDTDVHVTANTVMHSANVTEPGTLKISWIAGENGAAGTLMTVDFAVSQANTDGKVNLTGEAHSGEYDEQDRTVGVLAAADPALTGDDTHPLLWTLLAVGGVLGVALSAWLLFRRKN